MRASRRALFRSTSKAQSDGNGMGILEILVTLLEDLYTDDRQAVPLLETIAIVMEQTIELEGDNGHKLPTRQLWNVVRKAHFKSTNIRKLEAAVRIYAALARQGDMGRNGLCKLRDLLLHPYPSVSSSSLDFNQQGDRTVRHAFMLTVLRADQKRSCRRTVPRVTERTAQDTGLVTSAKGAEGASQIAEQGCHGIGQDLRPTSLPRFDHLKAP
jgi:Tubulin folding cofactor D C terminal